MGNAGLEKIWCPTCDRAGNPSRMVKTMGTRSEGMTVKCANGLHTFTYSRLMSLNPRMDKPEFVEKQPPNTVSINVWIYPEVLESLKQKFPSNLMTTLCSVLTALGDPDSVLIEGEHAREMATMGIRRGREVLGLAREVIELRKKVERLEIQMEPFRNLLTQMGPGSLQPEAPMPSNRRPPHAQFENLVESDNGMLMPSDGVERRGNFVASGPAPTPSTVPGFIARLNR